MRDRLFKAQKAIRISKKRPDEALVWHEETGSMFRPRWRGGSGPGIVNREVISNRNNNLTTKGTNPYLMVDMLPGKKGNAWIDVAR